jgi:hypothetical protein
MEVLDINHILGREQLASSFVNSVNEFFHKRESLSVKRGYYVYGSPGSGKSEFVCRTLKKAGFDVVKYDAGDVRNKNVIESINKNQMGDSTIMSLWNTKRKRIVIVMDEIDGMNNGDKGGINALIKLIRPKKTKKQQSDNINSNPIVCIGNYHVDKKITDLMKVCNTYEIRTPSPEQIATLVSILHTRIDSTAKQQIVEYVQGDLRRLSRINQMMRKGMSVESTLFQKVLAAKSCNDDAKQTVRRFMNTRVSPQDHGTVMSETDRTIVALLWHENVIDGLKKLPKDQAIPLYFKILDPICVGDYVDRITYQKQMWQLSELSSYIKTMHGNHIYHNEKEKPIKYNPSEVRFTKVLTKYSTEFNNFSFVANLCQRLGLDKKDLYTYFSLLRTRLENGETTEVQNELEMFDVSKLEHERITRMLERDLEHTPV